MPKEQHVQLIDLITCLSEAMDYIDPLVVSHHQQVAYIAGAIGEQAGLKPPEQRSLVLAGALHDIGAFSHHERKELHVFEVRNPDLHARRGYALLRLFPPLAGIAPAVRHHHAAWDHGRGESRRGTPIPLAAHILHLADRIAVLIKRDREVLGQVPSIVKTIVGQAGRMFKPDLVEAFEAIADREYFWLDLTSPSLRHALAARLKGESFGVGSEEMLGFSQLFARIIDFKSPFTATHSSGIAASSSTLAGLSGFSRNEVRNMKVAGFLHDLGKLAVPVEILDKPSQLDRKERNVVRHHSFYTYRILETIPSLRVIDQWAAYHHERLDGSGYPFHLTEKDLSLGSQIMAVADVFTALAEDRPYRAGMRRSSVMQILQNMADNGGLNGDLVSLLGRNYDEIDMARIEAQKRSSGEYRTLSEPQRVWS